jgi:hypothetical protein
MKFLEFMSSSAGRAAAPLGGMPLRGRAFRAECARRGS